ncbi:TetR/AcrR family transcriptional regulator, partial [Vibrio lentus]
EKILDASEIVLRKFGPRKTTVVDVARALDVSHGTVYRHFATKAELHEAITLRWLERVTAPLTEITHRSESASIRLREW